jgi:hypothetical protein
MSDVDKSAPDKPEGFGVSNMESNRICYSVQKQYGLLCRHHVLQINQPLALTF